MMVLYNGDPMDSEAEAFSAFTAVARVLIAKPAEVSREGTTPEEILDVALRHAVQVCSSISVAKSRFSYRMKAVHVERLAAVAAVEDAAAILQSRDNVLCALHHARTLFAGKEQSGVPAVKVEPRQGHIPEKLRQLVTRKLAFFVSWAASLPSDVFTGLRLVLLRRHAELAAHTTPVAPARNEATAGTAPTKTKPLIVEL